MNQTFEEFLQEFHIKLYPQILDDDLTDSFDKWLGDLDGEEYINYAELYGKSQFLAGKTELLNKISQIL